MRWTPEELASDAGGELLRAGRSAIAGAFIDSRQPRRDALFVPIVAARDGHDFLPQAISAGAGAVLVGRGHTAPPGDCTVVRVEDTLEGLTQLARSARARRRAAGVPAVAITGSNGKTTTRAMVEAVLNSSFDRVLSTQGNFNNHLGVPLSLLDAPHEPEAEVLELGMSAPGENDHLASIVQPQVGVVTSIALEHLEFMGSLEAIAKAEAELMPHVAPEGALVIPDDVPLLDAQIPADYRPRVWRVGPESSATVQIVEVEVGLRTRCVFLLPGGERVQLSLATFGAHNARNAGAALAVGLALGLPLQPMVEAIEAVQPVGDRGRVRRFGEHLLICDCYNANPGSMEVALDSLARLRDASAGPLIAVLGDMLELGPTEGQLHREVGQRAAELGVDALLSFGPLSEDIAAGAEAFGMTRVERFSEVSGVGPVRAAAESLRGLLADQPAGAVLFKASRGIALERVINELLEHDDPSS
jgi:UDP-N-acetylmuramoyl-tripeptide--D-alanyl-D-alanine ligase